MHLATTGPSVKSFSFDPEPSGGLFFGYISDKKNSTLEHYKKG
jgi:hypothetical protein